MPETINLSAVLPCKLDNNLVFFSGRVAEVGEERPVIALKIRQLITWKTLGLVNIEGYLSPLTHAYAREFLCR